MVPRCLHYTGLVLFEYIYIYSIYKHACNTPDISYVECVATEFFPCAEFKISYIVYIYIILLYNNSIMSIVCYMYFFNLPCMHSILFQNVSEWPL